MPPQPFQATTVSFKSLAKISLLYLFVYSLWPYVFACVCVYVLYKKMVDDPALMMVARAELRDLRLNANISLTDQKQKPTINLSLDEQFMQANKENNDTLGMSLDQQLVDFKLKSQDKILAVPADTEVLFEGHVPLALLTKRIKSLARLRRSNSARKATSATTTTIKNHSAHFGMPLISE